jgi:hypothetical protein
MKKSITFFLNSNGNDAEEVRKKSANFLRSHGVTEESVQKKIMLIKELLKIFVQYNSFKPPQKKMTVQFHICRNKITFEVSNPIKGIQTEKLERLDKTIQFLRGYQDPLEAYLKLKDRSDFGPDELALAKLNYEGKMMLDFFVSEDNIMTMSAVTAIN